MITRISFKHSLLSVQLCLNRNMKTVRLEIHWSYFHLGPFQRVLTSLPPIPDHGISFGTAVTIDAIQVWAVTAVVPPGSTMLSGTVAARPPIIILILRAKELIIVPPQRVTSSSWDGKSNQQTFISLCTTTCSSQDSYWGECVTVHTVSYHLYAVAKRF